MPLKLIEDKKLQKLADTKDAYALRDASDFAYDFDVNDPDDCCGLTVHGLEAGLELAEKVNEIRVRYNITKEVVIVRISFPDYVEDDGLAVFVGTKAMIKERISALAANDEDEGEDEDDE